MADTPYIPVQAGLLQANPDPSSALNQVAAAQIQAARLGILQNTQMDELLDSMQVKPAQRKQAVAEANKRVADINELSAPERATAFKKLQAENAQLTSQIQLQPLATEAQRQALNTGIAQSQVNTATALNQALPLANLTPEELVQKKAELEAKQSFYGVKGYQAPLPKTVEQWDDFLNKSGMTTLGKREFIRGLAAMGLSDPSQNSNASMALYYRMHPEAGKFALEQADKVAASVESADEVKEFKVLDDKFKSIFQYVQKANVHDAAVPDKEGDASVVGDQGLSKDLSAMWAAKMAGRMQGVDPEEINSISGKLKQYYNQAFGLEKKLSPAQRTDVLGVAQRIRDIGLASAGPALKTAQSRLESNPGLQYGAMNAEVAHYTNDKYQGWLKEYLKKGSVATSLSETPAAPAGAPPTGADVRQIPGRAGWWMLDPADPTKVIPYAGPAPIQNAPPAPMIIRPTF